MDAGQVTRTDVPEAFDEVAERYDLMVGLSPGYHAQLRASADALLGAIPDAAVVVSAEGESARSAAPLHLLDLGCGSGASTRALVEAVRRHAGPGGRSVARPAAVLAVDGSPGMLDAARSKAWPSWVASTCCAARRACAACASAFSAAARTCAAWASASAARS